MTLDLKIDQLKEYAMFMKHLLLNPQWVELDESEMQFDLWLVIPEERDRYPPTKREPSWIVELSSHDIVEEIIAVAVVEKPHWDFSDLKK